MAYGILSPFALTFVIGRAGKKRLCSIDKAATVDTICLPSNGTKVLKEMGRGTGGKKFFRPWLRDGAL
jgi:hypothetical protein